MSKSKFKVIVLTHGGAADLLAELAAIDGVEVTTVFVETSTEQQRPLIEKLRRSIKYDGWSATGAKFLRSLRVRSDSGKEKSIKGEIELETLRTAAKVCGVSIVEVENYHQPGSLAKIRRAEADLGIVYGTNIIRETVFSIPRLGSINLHQGHAPFYRGGPTVFWELMNGEGWLGITIHFVAAKVDTGDIVQQEFVDLKYDFAKYGLDYERFLDDFRATLVKPSAKLMADAVKAIASGTYDRKKQDLSHGKRYRLPTKKEKDMLRSVLRDRFSGN